jgi:hypothetical protein
MSLKANEPFTWTDPSNGEVYHFVATDVVEFGNIYTITLPDGTTFDAFGQEINCPAVVTIYDSQVNPVEDDEPVRYGAMR